MAAYVIRRLLLMIPTFLGISVLLFCVIRLAPGDPATVKFGSSTGADGGSMDAGAVDKAAAIKKFREKFHLDEPLPKQYGYWIADIAQLDLGTEMFQPTVQIKDEMWRRLKNVTLPLATISILLAYLIAIPIGIYSAARQGTTLDTTAAVLLFILFSIPTFWAGLMLILLFGPTGVDWLPILGMHSVDTAGMTWIERAWDVVLHMIMPVATMTYGSLAYISRFMRVGMLEVIRQDYVRTARAKGLGERVVVLKHAARNSLIPVVTLFASILPTLIGGSLVVETVFGLPGMGRYAFDALQTRDYNVIMATSTVSAVLTMLGFLLSDVAYAIVDPRIAYD